MLMGDCLALLQDGYFLAQLFWFNVPGGQTETSGVQINLFLDHPVCWWGAPKLASEKTTTGGRKSNLEDKCSEK